MTRKSTLSEASSDASDMADQPNQFPPSACEANSLVGRGATQAEDLSLFERSYARAHGKKKLVSEWFAGTLLANELKMKSGCTRKTSTLGLDDEKLIRESHRTLFANIGDRLMLFGASIDQIATVEIRWIRPPSFFVSVGAGGVNDGTVWVMKL